MSGGSGQGPKEAIAKPVDFAKQRFVVMGAGEVGFHLARTLSQDGHDVIVIEADAAKCDRVEEEIDAAVVSGVSRSTRSRLSSPSRSGVVDSHPSALSAVP